ncbi:UDP-N-acetylmuramoyl-tripeptide--D-alanyl-D-alanine ligase [Ligilactobacillus ruminis]|uniref:UDP-N-acetylmuramoyl-tripeptide--D-alanyl-D- alanine ligase n=1 Tax=Ligilactobacillus ruminis TaxID=1623 RepID=UPI0014765F4D|nr:UDP-N-acetylmuramoyl-tripeptide--D-alanyl-D-alanine ligase [Ligilactobacillus ruminis]NME32093.1 UDP-N-acetylmuramoyl-tripeptide--D-alanyl-D-alanine ligase [Ligilactobacillus ruminis]
MKMQLSEVARALGIESDDQYDQITITSVSFDSRSLEQGALFVPLIASNDGHEFVEAAKQNGACAALWQKDHENRPQGIPLLIVDDTLEALQKIGKYYLQKINPKVVAITGSNGKTTTKDMIAAVLSTQFNVAKTRDNFNNHIGVPMTVLSMEPNTEILVVEIGMDHFGELDHLVRLVDPDVAVITMIGEAHIEFFKTRDRIADAKMEITHALKEDGVLVYNGDEPLLIERAEKLDFETKTFGTGANVDLQAQNIVSDAEKTSFRVKQWPELNFTIPMIGAYNVKNALAALCVGSEFQIDPRSMVKSLEHFDLTKNRTEWVKASNGAAVLSDVYNSNPTACAEVLTAFQNAETTGRRYAVLGDMLELGEQGPKMHAGLADKIDPKKVDEVFLCGPLMKNLAEALTDKFDQGKIHHYATSEKEQLVSDLKERLRSEDMVMLKGSHGIHLEDVLAELR